MVRTKCSAILFLCKSTFSRSVQNTANPVNQKMLPLWWGGIMVNNCWKQLWGYGNQPPEQWIHFPPSQPLSQSCNTILQPWYFLLWLMAESWVEVNSGGSVAPPQKWREEELIWRVSVDIVQCIFNCISRLAGIPLHIGSCYPSACCSFSWVISCLSPWLHLLQSETHMQPLPEIPLHWV